MLGKRSIVPFLVGSTILSAFMLGFLACEIWVHL
jgi:hypothetical protein